jgi:hypothetical protein
MSIQIECTWCPSAAVFQRDGEYHGSISSSRSIATSIQRKEVAGHEQHRPILAGGTRANFKASRTSWTTWLCPICMTKFRKYPGVEYETTSYIGLGNHFALTMIYQRVKYIKTGDAGACWTLSSLQKPSGTLPVNRLSVNRTPNENEKIRPSIRPEGSEICPGGGGFLGYRQVRKPESYSRRFAHGPFVPMLPAATEWRVWQGWETSRDEATLCC